MQDLVRGAELHHHRGRPRARPHKDAKRSLHLSETPGEVRWSGSTLGEHNEEVYGELGIGKHELEPTLREGHPVNLPEQPLRSYLYVPGYDGRRIEKAFASEADAIVLDLEDAVAPNHKEEARETVARVLESEPEKPVFVRVTRWEPSSRRRTSTRWRGGNLAGLRLPKTESVESKRLWQRRSKSWAARPGYSA